MPITDEQILAAAQSAYAAAENRSKLLARFYGAIELLCAPDTSEKLADLFEAYIKGQKP